MHAAGRDEADDLTDTFAFHRCFLAATEGDGLRGGTCGKRALRR
ncbi:MAG: hypothetical protein QOI87_3958 [Bradyrhizobium sp.]|jgi:hypothetical protein|nr:hypothetical protein [Bradyrhizobium sp.]